MQKKSLLILACFAGVMIGIAVYVAVKQQPVESVGAAGPLYPDLTESLNDIAQVSIRDAQSQATLNRDGDVWVVAEKGGYPADVSKLRKQLLALARSQRKEQKTSNPDLYGRLGVQDIQSADATGVVVSLTGVTTPGDLIVGKTGTGSIGTYIRFANEDAAWLVNEAIDFSAQPADWIKEQVVDIPSTQVKRVQIQRNDDRNLTIMKPTLNTPNFVVVDLPEGRELLSPSASNAVATALESLTIEDALVAENVEIPKEGLVVTTIETFDGQRIVARSWEADQRYLTSISVEFDPGLFMATDEPKDAETAGNDAASEESGDDDIAENEQARPEGNAQVAAGSSDGTSEIVLAQARAESNQEAVHGWVFEIPQYKFNNLTKKWDDILKPLPAAAEDNE